MTEESRPRAAPAPDDRELDQYLKGDSKLSRLYQEASREQSPPELDEAILAAAKREVRARPGLSKLLAPVALAASLILGVNLAWNVHNAAPVPAVDTAAAPRANVPRAAPAPAPAPEKTQPALRQELAQAQEQRLREMKKAQAAKEADEGQLAAAQERQAERAQRASAAMESRAAAGAAGNMAPAAAPSVAAMADAVAPAPLTEPQKIDRLLAYVGSLEGAVFVRNGQDHTPAEAVEHMKLKRQKAGDRVKTAEDFIKYCASYSTLTGEAYLVRFPDGRTRTAEDVLREELAKTGVRPLQGSDP